MKEPITVDVISVTNSPVFLLKRYNNDSVNFFFFWVLPIPIPSSISPTQLRFESRVIDVTDGGLRWTWREVGEERDAKAKEKAASISDISSSLTISVGIWGGGDDEIWGVSMGMGGVGGPMTSGADSNPTSVAILGKWSLELATRATVKRSKKHVFLATSCGSFEPLALSSSLGKFFFRLCYFF